MTTTTCAAEIEHDEHDVAAQIANAKDDGEIDAVLKRHQPERQTKAEILSLGLASAANRVAVLAAIGQALPEIGDKPTVINCYGDCALPTAVDVDAVTAADRSSGPAGRRWLLAVVDADEDGTVVRQKRPPRTIVLAVSRKPITEAIVNVACN